MTVAMAQPEAMTYAAPLRIAADHPALAGHFPGRPIAPGVLLLDLAIEHAERWLGRPLRIESLMQAKFTSPLPPEQQAQLELFLKAEQLRFVISRDGVQIAQGVLRLRAERPA